MAPRSLLHIPLQCVADIRQHNVVVGDSGGAVGLDLVAAFEEALPALRPLDLCGRLVRELSVYHGRHDHDSGQHVARLLAHVLRRPLVELELGNCRGYFIGKRRFIVTGCFFSGSGPGVKARALFYYTQFFFVSCSHTTSFLY